MKLPREGPVGVWGVRGRMVKEDGKEEVEEWGVMRGKERLSLGNSWMRAGTAKSCGVSGFFKDILVSFLYL